MEIKKFQGDLTDISAKKEPLLPTDSLWRNMYESHIRESHYE